MSAVGRPIGVTLVGVLIVISGVFGIVAGVLGLFDADLRVGASLVTLVLIIVIGLVYLLVAKGLFNGNSFARALVALLTFINLVVGVVNLIFVSGMRWNGLVLGLFSLIILALLFSARANAFFRGA